MTSRLTIIKGPHLLYVGANGSKIFGITVKNNFWSVGYQKEFNLNDHTLINSNKESLCEMLGINHEDLEKIQHEIMDLTSED